MLPEKNMEVVPPVDTFDDNDGSHTREIVGAIMVSLAGSETGLTLRQLRSEVAKTVRSRGDLSGCVDRQVELLEEFKWVRNNAARRAIELTQQGQVLAGEYDQP